MTGTYSTEGVECPHCNRLHVANDPDMFSENYTEDECGWCEKKFSVMVNTTTSWTCERIEGTDD